METTVFDVVGNVYQILGLSDVGLVVAMVKEFTFDTVDQCWQAAQAFNTSSKEDGQPLVMACWPNPSEALIVSE